VVDWDHGGWDHGGESCAGGGKGQDEGVEAHHEGSRGVGLRRSYSEKMLEEEVERRFGAGRGVYIFSRLQVEFGAWCFRYQSLVVGRVRC